MAHTHTHAVTHTHKHMHAHMHIHTHTHCDTHIPIPSEDCKPTGLKVDTAKMSTDSERKTNSELLIAFVDKFTSHNWQCTWTVHWYFPAESKSQ